MNKNQYAYNQKFQDRLLEENLQEKVRVIPSTMGIYDAFYIIVSNGVLSEKFKTIIPTKQENWEIAMNNQIRHIKRLLEEM